MNNVFNEGNSKQLMADFKAVVADAEALIKATAGHSDEKLVEIRAQAEESLKIAKARIAEMQEAVMLKMEHAVKATDVYVHENPWQSMAVAAGAGLIVGFLLNRH